MTAPPQPSRATLSACFADAFRRRFRSPSGACCGSGFGSIAALARVLSCAFAVSVMCPSASAEKSGAAVPPNVIIVFADDMGYGDAPGYGEKALPMPHFEQLADEGMRFTDFYVTASVCSASRAALLTGRYGVRTGVTGVISANSSQGLPPEETTLAERFRELGYATAIFGKWHLGNTPDLWPLRRGFDEWFGSIGSNDMGKGRPSLEERRRGRAGVEMVEGEKVVETNPDQRHLTRRYTDRAVDFIRRNAERPFFLYVPHNMPHTPLFVSEDFDGKSGRGLYGDVLLELDWSLGEIVRAVDEAGLGERTVIAFTSDNGPWLKFGDHAGTAGPLDGGKKQTLEGGFRVPLAMRWTGRIPAGSVCGEMVTALDFTPSLMALAGAQLEGPERERLDGRDVSALWLGGSAAEDQAGSLLYFWERELRALRRGPWKLRLAHVERSPDPENIGYGGVRGGVIQVARDQALFRLDRDPGETTDLSADEPEALAEMLDHVHAWRSELGELVEKWNLD